MKRRRFVRELAGVGASAAGLAFAGACGLLPAAHPQHNPTVRVGVLGVSARADSESSLQAFLERAHELGWLDGQNMIVEDRWGNAQRDALARLAADLARLPVDVIVAGGNASIQAARQATSTIPIVMAGLASNPVTLGLIASLAHPGGNITGLSNLTPMLSTKRLEILAEVVPGLTRVAVLVTPDNPSKPQNVSELQVAADVLGIQLQVEDVAMDDLPRAFEAARAWPAQALLLIGDAVLTTVTPRIVALVDQLPLPATYSDSSFVEAGGLMSYSTDALAIWRRAADFVDKILRGASPADLPVELPTTFHLAMNVKAAQALGLTLPSDVAAQVTEWVE